MVEIEMSLTYLEKKKKKRLNDDRKKRKTYTYIHNFPVANDREEEKKETLP